ncbi:LlaJI family restriction endonuclease [Bacillus toyonensis]|uniref:LlaJI family restriction endonuclease n=1 Tax=Bacillus toyonensis TaxID=155322 RepID=UPI0025417D43|nr:LlaJI family restriction endonuclease [Bacillus toyonensis]WIG30105.1 LlaJI family restriction endonuclease [Bacillus toyonensis]
MLNIKDHCFIENVKYSTKKLKVNLGVNIFKAGLCEEINQVVIFRFVGFYISDNNEFIVVFPKGYKIPGSEVQLSEDIANLINTLSRYQKESNFDPENTQILGDAGNYTSLSAANWLIKDFITNGIFINNKISYVRNQNNNIDWPKTIKYMNPVISNKQVAYLEFVSRKKRTDESNLLTRVHGYIVYQSFKILGPFIGLKMPPELIEYNNELLQEYDINQIIHFVEQERNNLFADREVHLCNKLIEFLKGNSSAEADSNIMCLAVRHFHVVWEKICSFLFANMSANNIMPNPFWQVNDKSIKTSQIPDVMLRNKNQLYIIDAKYYTLYKNLKGLPGWGDLVKQFFYLYTLKDRVDNIREMFNIFVFPGTSNEIIKYYGKAAVEGVESLGHIYGFTLDVSQALKMYAHYNNNQMKNNLVEVVQRSI